MHPSQKGKEKVQPLFALSKIVHPAVRAENFKGLIQPDPL
jgi:hypothetical protein